MSRDRNDGRQVYEGAMKASTDALMAADTEIARLRSHVSRLEESLRVALEARAEAVEVLREVIAMLPEPYTPGDGCEHGFVRDSVDEPCPFVECEDRKIAALLDRAGRAIGGAK